MIRHTVAFRLKHPKGSEQERAFLLRSLELVQIPGVRNFEQLRQVSPKNSFTFGFVMRFDNLEAYEAYQNHPIHTAYVRDVWVPEVVEFMETDYMAL